MLYNHRSGSPLPFLAPVAALSMSECDNIDLLSALCSITREEVRRRLANDHRAYVAYYQGKPAAFGWLAGGKVRVGELNHEIILPIGQRYLWNFRTLVEYRGLGIYPHLLQYVLKDASSEAESFWILHAPENLASEKGIRRAGFLYVGNVSVVSGRRMIFKGSGESTRLQEELVETIESLGFPYSVHEQAVCWNCSSPWLAHKRLECCCETSGMKVCNGDLFLKEMEQDIK